MPQVIDIINEALDIAFEHLQTEPLVRETVWRKIKKKAKLMRYHTRTVYIATPEETAAKKLASRLKSEQVKIKLSGFTAFEKEILEIVCDVHKIRVEDFVLHRRLRELVDARFQFAAIFRLQFSYTFLKLGRLLSKDHSSIIHAIHKHKDFYETLSDYKNQYIRVLNEVEKRYPGLLKTTLNPNITIVQSITGMGKSRKTILDIDTFKEENEEAN